MRECFIRAVERAARTQTVFVCIEVFVVVGFSMVWFMVSVVAFIMDKSCE